jgi:D-tyrosyl-tRNA(Tyr) deacylase
MRFVIQRVTSADVSIDNKTVGSIGHGLLILFGACDTDTEEMLPKFADKIVKLRIFADAEGKTNLSINDVGGELLIVSQFTLYADCRKGNRPSFVHAGSPDAANLLYEKFVSLCRERVPKVETGVFGAEMKVRLENDGPFTVVIDSRDFE